MIVALIMNMMETLITLLAMEPGWGSWWPVEIPPSPR